MTKSGEHQLLDTVQSNRNAHSLPKGMPHGVAALGDSLTLSDKPKHSLTT